MTQFLKTTHNQHKLITKHFYRITVKNNLVLGIIQGEDETLVFILILLIGCVTHIEHLFLHVHSQLFHFTLRDLQIITLTEPEEENYRIVNIALTTNGQIWTEYRMILGKVVYKTISIITYNTIKLILT